MTEEEHRLRRNAARGWPDWARDRVYTEVDVRPSLMDRLRILLSGRLLVATTMYVDQEISHTKQEPSLASALFPWERWRLQWLAKHRREWGEVVESSVNRG